MNFLCSSKMIIKSVMFTPQMLLVVVFAQTLLFLFFSLFFFFLNLQLNLFCCLLYRLNTEIQPKQKLGKWKPFASEQKPSNRNWLFVFTALLPILMCCDSSNQNSCNLNKFVLWRTLFIIYSSLFLFSSVQYTLLVSDLTLFCLHS